MAQFFVFLSLPLDSAFVLVVEGALLEKHVFVVLLGLVRSLGGCFETHVTRCYFFGMKGMELFSITLFRSLNWCLCTVCFRTKP